MTSDIEYRDTRDLPPDQVLSLYRSVRWSSADKPDELISALAGSHAVVTAWDGDRLVGLGNTISDGALVVYYPHLVVHPDYQRRGIGREIVRRLKVRYVGFHQHAILADGRATQFYEKCGFTRPTSVHAMWVYAGDDHGAADTPLSMADGGASGSDDARTLRQKWAIGLCIAQFLAIYAAAVAAIVDVESIMGTGPVLIFSGLTLGFISRWLRSWVVLLFSLSGPGIFTFCYLLIALFRWGPGPASDPIVVLLSAYAVLITPLGAVALFKLLRWRGAQFSPGPFVWRYSIRSMLWLMVAVAVGGTLYRLIAPSTNDSYGFAFGSLLILALGGGVLAAFLKASRCGPGGRPQRDATKEPLPEPLPEPRSAQSDHGKPSRPSPLVADADVLGVGAHD